MPTYTYRCTRCVQTFDQWQKFSDVPLQTCPRCEGSLRRVPHAVGLVFTGGGFYCTDSRTHKSASKAVSASTAA